MTDWNNIINSADERDYEVEDLVDWLSTQTDNDFAMSLVAFYEEKEYLSPSQLASAKAMREQESDPVIEEGRYRTAEGDEVRVRLSRNNRFYAVNDDNEYLAGYMKTLRGSMRVGDL
jgi:hypothetical protein